MDGWNAVTPRGKACECPLSFSGLLGVVVRELEAIPGTWNTSDSVIFTETLQFKR